MTVFEVPLSSAGVCSSKGSGEYAQASRFFADRVVFFSDCAALVVGAAIVLELFVFFLWQSGRAQYFTPYSLLEEAAYTFISANNYLRFGYFNSGFLQDFSTSLSALDHPYVYNHMPPGPDLLTSVLLWLFDGNYASVRTFFAISMLAGFVVFFLFGRMLLQHLGMQFSGILLVLISPWVIIQLFDRQIYSPFLLLAFLPLLLVFQFLKNNRAAYFAIAIVVIVLSAIYIEYSLLSAIIFCWVMLYATQLMALKFRHMVLIGAAFGVGIGAHLLQNMLYLGWDNFVLELKYTISNRTTGFPTQEELKDYYHRLGVVHHGARSIDSIALMAQVRETFAVPVARSAALMLLSCVLWVFSGHGFRFSVETAKPVFVWSAVRAKLLLFVRLLAWVVVTVLAPIILFPAFAQEVNLRGSGANFFFLAIPLAFVAGYGLWVLSYAGHRAATILISPMNSEGRPNVELTEAGPAVAKLGILVARMIAMIGICLALIGGAIAILRNTKAELSHIHVVGQNPNKWSPLYDIGRFSGELFMTNINVPTVGFLTQAPGFGACGPDSVAGDGQLHLHECKTAFMRRYEYWSAQRPRYFFYFTAPELFPGFADCLPGGVITGSTRGGRECMQELLDSLASRYRLVMKNNIVSVFDLGKSRAQRGPN